MLRLMVVMTLLAASNAGAQQKEASGPARAEAPRKVRIAVLDVQYAGAGDRKTVEGLSALLASEVARRPNLVVLAGSDLRALVGFERQKALLGCTESSCITELAGALGVAYLVSSEVSKVGSTWLVSLTLLDANKAMAQGRLTRKAYSDDQLVDETSTAVDELLTALPGAGTPAPRSAEVARADLSAAPPPGSDQQPAGYHKHDGFFLRFQLGYGGLSSVAPTTEYSGTAGSFAVGLGVSLTENLILFGEIYDDVNTSPTVKSGGIAVTDNGTVTHTLIGYGAGLSWYVTSLNAYLSASGGVGHLQLESTDAAGVVKKGATQNGPMVRLTVGKEWWVSTNWGIGASINFEAGSMKDAGVDPATFKTTAFSLAFSATYN
jgi:TolB-like protein